MPLLATENLLLESGDRLLQEAGDSLLLEQSFEGFSVLDVWPNWETLPQEGRAFSGTVLDNMTGLHVVKPRGDSQRHKLKVQLRFATRTELARFRRFIDGLRGRQKPFWIPTWQQDMVVTTDFSGTTMVIESVGYAGRLFPYEPRKRVAIINHTRTMHLVRLTGATDNGTTESLTLTTAPSETIIANASLVSLLLLVRLAADEVIYTYVSPEHMTATLDVIEVPKEVSAP